MAAGLGFKVFATGDILTASDANGYLMSQTVMVFADAAARTAAIASPQQGMISFLKGTNSTEYYNGTAWTSLTSVSPLTTKGDLYGFSTVNARIPVGTNGQVLTADSTQALGLKWATPANTAGLVLINATSFTSSSAVNVDSVFSSTYTNYRIVTSFKQGNGADTYMRLRSGGVSQTTAKYETHGYIQTSAAPGGFSTATQAQWLLGQGGQSAAGMVMDIYSPNVTGYVSFTSQFTGLTSGSYAAGFGVSGYYDGSYQADGFSLYPTAGGSITGTVRVYGYAN